MFWTYHWKLIRWGCPILYIYDTHAITKSLYWHNIQKMEFDTMKWTTSHMLSLPLSRTRNSANPFCILNPLDCQGNISFNQNNHSISLKIFSEKLLRCKTGPKSQYWLTQQTAFILLCQSFFNENSFNFHQTYLDHIYYCR